MKFTQINQVICLITLGLAPSFALFATPKEDPALQPDAWLLARETSTHNKSTGGSQKSMAHKSGAQDAQRTYFGISGDVGMIHVNTGYGLELWMGRDNQYQAGFQYLVASETLKGNQDDVLLIQERMRLNLQQANLFLRIPIADVVYASFNLAFNTIQGDYGFTSVSPSQQSSYVTYKYTSIAPSFAIGSQWIFRNGMVLGVDWLGYSVPLTYNLAIAGSGQSAATAQVYTILAQLGDKTAKGIVLKNIQQNYGVYYTLVRLGYQF